MQYILQMPQWMNQVLKISIPVDSGIPLLVSHFAVTIATVGGQTPPLVEIWHTTIDWTGQDYVDPIYSLDLMTDRIRL